MAPKDAPWNCLKNVFSPFFLSKFAQVESWGDRCLMFGLCLDVTTLTILPFKMYCTLLDIIWSEVYQTYIYRSHRRLIVLSPKLRSGICHKTCFLNSNTVLPIVVFILTQPTLGKKKSKNSFIQTLIFYFIKIMIFFRTPLY
jgi:hypothetical protein